jgi:chromatin remodeling complex protein RSC6
MPPKKTTTAKASTVSAPAPVPTDVVTTPPVEEVPAPVSTPVIPEVVKTDAPTTEVAPVVEQDRFALVLEKLQNHFNELKEVIATVKILQKENAKMVKITTKKSAKKNNAAGNRTLSGFAKPSLLSDELCKFMEVPVGTSLARTEVTRKIHEYIRAQKLHDENDKRIICPDEKLRGILNLNADDKLTYFNLQKYMKHQFPKAVVPPVAGTPQPVAA